MPKFISNGKSWVKVDSNGNKIEGAPEIRISEEVRPQENKEQKVFVQVPDIPEFRKPETVTTNETVKVDIAQVPVEDIKVEETPNIIPIEKEVKKEKPKHKCDICGKEFAHLGAKTGHLRSHR